MLSLKRHADQLTRSAYDAVYHNAKAKIIRKWRRGEITQEQAKEEIEMLDCDLQYEEGSP